MPVAGIFLIPNATFIVELIIFVVILGAIAKWILPPLRKAMEERQAQIADSLASAERAKHDAEAADDERHHVLEAARHQAREIVTQAGTTAEQIIANAQAQAQAEHDRIVESARAEVAIARQAAVEEVTARVGEIVLAAAERVIGREIRAEDHHDLIEEAIAAVRAEAGTGLSEAAGSGR